jgi:glycosyltransferase involved in cell wall biosynthesis
MADRSPRVLVIAHGFPPASGSGAVRALAFARYLPMHGWRPTVLTVGSAWAANRDDSLLAEVRGDLEVLRTRSFEPRAAPRAHGPPLATASKASPLRRHLGHLKRFPDAHLGWLPFAVSRALRQPAEVLYSSSGPFTSHLVGLAVQRLTGRPWVAELRDGWYEWNRAIFPDYPAWRGPLESRLEGAVIRSAQRVVLVTERMANAFRCQYADLPAEHFAVVSNGFDPAQFPPSSTPGGDHFEVVHAGALYYGRSLASFLDAAARVMQADPEFAAAFRLTLLGTLDRAARAELARSALGERVDYHGQVDHVSSLVAMRAASLLLLVANTTPGAEATVPGKVFEYLASGRPMLAIVPSTASSSADLLDRTQAGWVARADDPAQIASALGAAFAADRAGQPRQAQPAEVARFDRRVLAGELAAIFDEVRAAHRL